MIEKKISIITPSYNQGQYIEQTIDSVLSQNYNNKEYIIIDGGSTDNTVEIIKKYEKHLKYWISEPDKGQSDAINKGFKYVTGDIINWLNSDDYYEPNTFKLLNEYFKDISINVVCGKSRLFGENYEQISKGTYIDKSNLSKTIGLSLMDQPATFFRTKIFTQLLPINISLRYLMDRELWIKYLILFGVNNIKKIDDIIVNFRMHKLSKTVYEGVNFDKERNTIFYSLAKKIQDLKVESILKSLYDINPNYKFPIKEIDDIIINKALKFFLFLIADEEYYKSNYNRANYILKNINLLEYGNKKDLFILKSKNFLKKNFFIKKH